MMSPIEEMFTNEFFAEVFKKHLANFKDVSKINVSNVVAAGESFSSELLRIRVTYSTIQGQNDEGVSVIVKILKDNEQLTAVNKDLKIYDTESSIYGEVFPLMAKIGFKQKIGPKVYLISKHPMSMLIMEDMSDLGYKMYNRQEGLDLEHCLVILKKLAIFHAASVVLQKNNPELLKKFNRSPCSKENIIKKFLAVTHSELLKVLSKVPGLQKYVKRIPTKETIYHKSYSAEIQSTTFNVLNHGDLWCNNIMFQYKPNGEVKDAVFVDYQLSYIASPCIDLHHLFGTSLKSQNKEKELYTALNYYFDELLSNLKKLGVYNIPTREELYEDFKERAMLGFGALCFIVPLIRAGNLEDTTIKMYLEEAGGESFRHHCFNNRQYVEELQQLLPFYEKLGVFD
ncbi:hypothetical protein FQA39_LY02852 [Lamprigera yunnana]|nr:hypothetical protein FQA39_LY02852 [Lamprigera yunnana]